MVKDILLDNDNDLLIEGGDFVFGESDMQDVGIILEMNPGELKSDPIIGAGLASLIQGNATSDEIEARVKFHLKRDGKNYNDIKKRIKMNLKRR